MHTYKRKKHQKAGEIKFRTLKSFFSCLVDGKHPPCSLAHFSARLMRMTMYGVCLCITGSTVLKSIVFANLSIFHRHKNLAD